MNNVNIIGNIANELELKYFDSGSCNVKFSVAVPVWDGKIKQNVAHFLDFIAWGKTAENICTYFQKGKKIGISGELYTESWEKDGQKHKKVMIRVDKFDFCGSVKEKSESDVKYSPQIQKYGEEEINADKMPF